MFCFLRSGLLYAILAVLQALDTLFELGVDLGHLLIQCLLALGQLLLGLLLHFQYSLLSGFFVDLADHELGKVKHSFQTAW